MSENSLSLDSFDLEQEQVISYTIAIVVIGGLIGYLQTGSIVGAFAWGLVSPGFVFLMAIVYMKMVEGYEEAIDEGLNSAKNSNSARKTNKQICPECGWQNPRRNNYCHDCGTELTTK